MHKTVKVNKLNMVKLPDTFRPTVLDTNKNGDATVDIHFGSNMDILVITAKNKQLSGDDTSRIKIIVGIK
jgi:hypothetical protein